MSVPVTSAVISDRYQAAVDYLYGRLNYERTPHKARSVADFKLARMEELLDLLGNPQLGLPTVHIAGSKGKGSTATMIARMAECAGLQAGLFTSPHISDYRERISINGRWIAEETVVELLTRMRPAIDRIDAHSKRGPTFFEITTALCWLYFEQQKVDLAVMEVGLGGRLDSTNLCDPLVTVITSISKDHTRILGDTLDLIAREKAGIIKRGVSVVSGVDAPPARTVIREVAQEKSAPLFELGQDFEGVPIEPEPVSEHELVPHRLQYRSPAQSTVFTLKMPGVHQVRNAALAVRSAELLQEQGIPITQQAIYDGLRTAHSPLRVEVVATKPLTIVDVAHNAASISALVETLKTLSVDSRIGVISFSQDKDAAELLRILDQHFDVLILTEFRSNPRAYTTAQLVEISQSLGVTRVVAEPDLPNALSHANTLATPDSLICVTGSFFLASEMKELLTTARKVRD